MSNAPSVSVVIPAYDNAGTIARAVASVLAQSRPVAEIIVVDDGSRDDPGAALAPLLEAPIPIRIRRHEANRGAAAARNTGIRAATGDTIAFLDADDGWRADKLARQVAALEKAGPDVLGCVGGFALHREGAPAPEIHRLRPRAPLWREMVWGCRLSPGSTLLVRRSAYDRVGHYDETLRRLEDWDWLIRFAKVSELAVVAEPVADVYLSHVRGPVNMAPTLAALDHIRARHLDGFAAHGLAAALRFRATLALESAAAFARAGNRARAALLMARAFATWPFQRREFFLQLSRAVSRTARI